jgi:hypothetical protein
MPDLEIVSMQEAQLRTIPERQRSYINEYAGYIQQLPTEQAGKLHVLEQENPLTIRRRLAVAAQALGTPLIIKRSGENIYFWREDRGEAESRPRRGRRARLGSPGGVLPLSDQPFSVPEAGTHGVPEEESPELDQLASEAERHVEQS